MAGEHNPYATLSRRQVALFERNPVCALCYRICMDMCAEYGGINFDLLDSIRMADDLCGQIIQNAWSLDGVEHYFDVVNNRLGHSRPAIACTFATVCVTFSCMDDLPAPVRQLARDFQGLIIGEGNELYDNLRSAAYRQDITLAYDTYGEPPPEPSLVHEYEQACQRAAQLEQELTYYKTQLKMKNKNQQSSAPVINVAGDYIANQHNEYHTDIHDNTNCPIYLTPNAGKERMNESTNEKGIDTRMKRLFLTPDGIEDMQRTDEEKNRFLNYLTEHHWSKRQLDCSRDNPVVKAIVCFCVKWQQLKYIEKKSSPTAIVRFLTDTCGLECASDETAVSAHIGRLLKIDYDKDVFFDVCDYFN